jgi:xylitol oxidase
MALRLPTPHPLYDAAAPSSRLPSELERGLIVPKATNWAGTHAYTARQIVKPDTVVALERIVRAADRVRVLGSRHSFNDICDTDGVLVDSSGLSLPPEVDRDRGIVTVTPGVRFGDVARALDGTGWALPNLGSLPHISVLGAVATGTHGSGVANRILADAVCRLRLMTGDGSIVTTRRGDADFHGYVVSLGALGVVIEAELQLVPTFDVVQTLDEGVEWCTLLPRVPQLLQSGYSVSVFTRWGAGDTEVLTKHRVHADEDMPRLGSRAKSALLVDGPNLTPRDRLVPWWAGLPHFRLEYEPSFGREIQSEFFVAASRAVQALEAVTELADELAPHLIVSEVRAIASDDHWLSPAYGRDSVALHFTWEPHPEEVDRLTSRLTASLAGLEARPHWGKRFVGNQSLAHLYPRAQSFNDLAHILDPHAKFRNGFLDRTLGTVDPHSAALRLPRGRQGS